MRTGNLSSVIKQFHFVTFHDLHLVAKHVYPSAITYADNFLIMSPADYFFSLLWVKTNVANATTEKSNLKGVYSQVSH